MFRIKIFSVAICLIIFAFSVPSNAKPILNKVYDQGPVILFDQDKFVDYVALYILIDKSHLKSNETIDQYVIQLEEKLSKQGAICQTFWNSDLPELPYNHRQQSFLVARFASDAFDQNLTNVLNAIFQPAIKEKFLYYDKNVLIQKNETSLNFDSLMNQDQENGFLDAVTLRRHLYLFFRGKINTFVILKSLSSILNNETKILEQSAKKSDSHLRHWLMVFQKFITEQIKQHESMKNSECLRIFTPIDFERNKILIDLDFKLQVERLFKNAEIKTMFKNWYLTEYLQSIQELEFNKDQEALLHLYSSCYLPDHSLFEIDLEVDGAHVETILKHFENFVEYYEAK